MVRSSDTRKRKEGLHGSRPSVRVPDDFNSVGRDARYRARLMSHDSFGTAVTANCPLTVSLTAARHVSGASASSINVTE